ncbi:hypothetical protein E9531_01120 [Lampropedia puyangensis]|uniref:Uncharacterized protein n=1 Tax=Lampropedia puyangensis TaxID=1330072 RepID=A0A4V4GSP0_9BURK|nr:hypothetical protein [Lampropedia puyangensis]THU05186.1 hypothetical protein E9531_01120 [Lampropedia puyangensis]
MRMIFSLMGVILTLAIIAVLMKQQLQPTVAPEPIAGASLSSEGGVVPQVNAGNAQQVQNQIKRDLEQALQNTQREIPE